MTLEETSLGIHLFILFNVNIGTESLSSPGFLDIQINGAYDFDFSVYPPPETDEHVHAHEGLEGEEPSLTAAADAAYRAGLDRVARRIVETGVTSLLPTVIVRSSTLTNISICSCYILPFDILIRLKKSPSTPSSSLSYLLSLPTAQHPTHPLSQSLKAHIS